MASQQRQEQLLGVLHGEKEAHVEQDSEEDDSEEEESAG
jgi:hypothetical protein